MSLALFVGRRRKEQLALFGEDVDFLLFLSAGILLRFFFIAFLYYSYHFLFVASGAAYAGRVGRCTAGVGLFLVWRGMSVFLLWCRSFLGVHPAFLLVCG